DASHWAFAGTGMKDGDAIEGIIGWEAHNEVSKKLPDIKVIAEGPIQHYDWPIWENIKKPGQFGTYAATYYDVAPGRNFVFSAATCWWIYAFDTPPGWKRSTWYDCRQRPDSRVEKITRNVLDEMIRCGKA